VLTTNTSLEPYFDEAKKMASKSMKNEGFHNYDLKEYVDARYKGQSFELRLPYEKAADIKSRFSEKHKETYGYSSTDEIEIVNVRVKAVIATSALKRRRKKHKHEEARTPIEYREAWIKDIFTNIPVYSREELKLGTYGEGPSIIEEYDSTLVVNPRWKWKVCDYGTELKR
jgi:N-methylhydantoinase A